MIKISRPILPGLPSLTRLAVQSFWESHGHSATAEIIAGYVDGKAFINDTQYFANVPLSAWEFYIGGYQPAQKWLKDRKGRMLGFEDILHYQKIIVALVETGRVMGEVDRVWGLA